MLSYRGYFTSQMNLRKLEKLVSLVAEIIAAIFIKHARPGKSATDREKQREREREREREIPSTVGASRRSRSRYSSFPHSRFAGVAQLARVM
jgi:phage gp16-like protein